VDRAQAASPAWSGRGKVLVVDDEEMLRRMLRTMLEGAGLQVLVASDGREAVERFREHSDTIGVVLLDLTMPEMGGAEALAALRAIRPDVRVILTSGYSENELSSGADDFLGKPFSLASLIDKVRRALEGRPP
jgi:CheY-like chemotaxis protein